jgi:DHA2 family lincomycin resistance protein-like MFS transporter
VLGVLLIATFVTVLNETLLSVALPTLIQQFRISAATAQWLNTGFLLTSAVVIPITGFLLQRFTTRSVFIVAMTMFSAGTLIAVVSPGFSTLLIGRIVQAGGTAIMLPLLMSTAMALVAPESRGRTMGTVAIVISVAPAIGPTISGLVLEVLNWRFLFIIVLPIAVVTLVLGATKVSNVTTPRRAPLDVVSVVVAAAAFGGILFGLSGIGERAAGSAQPINPVVPIVFGALALALVVLRQRHLVGRPDSAPLLDLRAFLSPTFSIAIAMLAVGCLALFGSLVILPIYMQTVIGLNTLTIGLLLLPGGVIQGALAPFVGRLYDRIGPTVILVIGATLVATGLWGMAAFLHQGTAAFVVTIMHVVLSIGLAFTFTPLFTAALTGLGPDLYAHGSAIVSTAQQLAAGIGTALFVTLLAAGAATSNGTGSTATADGVHVAFLVGASIALAPIGAAFFVRNPRR